MVVVPNEHGNVLAAVGFPPTVEVGGLAGETGAPGVIGKIGMTVVVVLKATPVPIPGTTEDTAHVATIFPRVIFPTIP